jgi:hypothetical protein
MSHELSVAASAPQPRQVATGTGLTTRRIVPVHDAGHYQGRKAYRGGGCERAPGPLDSILYGAGSFRYRVTGEYSVPIVVITISASTLGLLRRP